MIHYNFQELLVSLFRYINVVPEYVHGNFIHIGQQLAVIVTHILLVSFVVSYRFAIGFCCVLNPKRIRAVAFIIRVYKAGESHKLVIICLKAYRSLDNMTFCFLLCFALVYSTLPALTIGKFRNCNCFVFNFFFKLIFSHKRVMS